MKVLIPLPANDVDPTETAIPWKVLSSHKVEVVFATPAGTKGNCDPRMVHGNGLGPFASFLRADKNGIAAFKEMEKAPAFTKPIKWSEIDPRQFTGILLPGGHAPGMREYLESPLLQKAIVDFFTANKPVAAVCHGVLLAARSNTTNGKSVLYGRKTTSLLAPQELLAWGVTCLWLGNYYRTYPTTVENEVRSVLEKQSDFIQGPATLLRDSPEHLNRGFVVRDGNYLSARWPGDAHAFASAFAQMLLTA